MLGPVRVGSWGRKSGRRRLVKIPGKNLSGRRFRFVRWRKGRGGLREEGIFGVKKWWKGSRDICMGKAVQGSDPLRIDEPNWPDLGCCATGDAVRGVRTCGEW